MRRSLPRRNKRLYGCSIRPWARPQMSSDPVLLWLGPETCGSLVERGRRRGGTPFDTAWLEGERNIMKNRYLAAFLTTFAAVLVAAPSFAGSNFTIVRPDGKVVENSGGAAGDPVFCTEAEDLTPPSCTNALGSCVAEAPDGICSRPGFLFRLTLCADPVSNPHEGHPFGWSAASALPPSLALVDPFGTSTAYVGGDFDTVPPNPPFHNGKHFGLLTGEFCGSFTVTNDDTCANGDNHDECSTAFVETFRTLDVDPAAPLPQVDDVVGTTPVVGQPLSAEVQASGGIENFIFSKISGDPPAGVMVNADGTITGTPTEAGTFTFTVRVAEDPADPIFTNPAACAAAPTCSTEFVDVEIQLMVDTTTTTTSSSSTTSTSMTTSTSTVTLGETTTTTLCPFPTDVCGQPVNPENVKPLATDCLYVLQAAVGSKPCCLCPCDVDSSGRTLATDALRCLQHAVGVDVGLQCDTCPAR